MKTDKMLNNSQIIYLSIIFKYLVRVCIQNHCIKYILFWISDRVNDLIKDKGPVFE